MSATTGRAIRKMVCVLGMAATTAHANPLMVFGGINGVVDALKSTTAQLKGVNTASKPSAKPRISLVNAHLIEQGMKRDAVHALVGAPVHLQSADTRNAIIRDIYKIQRTGLCAMDQVVISYAPNDGPVQRISQTCGDVTSSENRWVEYSFALELPPAFEGIQTNALRDTVIEALGAPVETRQGRSALTFEDVHLFGETKLVLTCMKGPKQLHSVSMGGTKVELPRLKRANFFETATAISGDKQP